MRKLKSRCFKSLAEGAGKYANTAGIKIMLIRKATMMFNPATIPNSFNNETSLLHNTKNPTAVVALVIKVTKPMDLMIEEMALFLSPSFLNSWWYLLNKYTKLGMPVMTIKDGTKPVSKDIL